MQKVENIRVIGLVLDEGFDPKEANNARKLILDKGYVYGRMIGINTFHKDVHTIMSGIDGVFFVPRKDSREISVTSLNTLALAQKLGKEVYSKRSNSHLRYTWDCEERSVGDEFKDSYKPCEVVRAKFK